MLNDEYVRTFFGYYAIMPIILIIILIEKRDAADRRAWAEDDFDANFVSVFLCIGFFTSWDVC